MVPSELVLICLGLDSSGLLDSSLRSSGRLRDAESRLDSGSGESSEEQVSSLIVSVKQKY